MQGLFSDHFRRNPYPFYQEMRSASPVRYIPPPFDAWMIFDYQGVQWVFYDHEAFSSQVPSPPHWMIFTDSPTHTKLRALVSQAFTPRTVANLAPRVQELSQQLLSALAGRREVDLVAAYSGPLPMMVIAGIMGMPVEDSARFNRWSDVILRLSHTRSGEAQAAQALSEFCAVSAEMATYIARLMELRRASPQDDILTKLVMAEVDGRHLNLPEIIGFMQLLMVAGQEDHH
jgi:cytochrome P450